MRNYWEEAKSVLIMEIQNFYCSSSRDSLFNWLCKYLTTCIKMSGPIPFQEQLPFENDDSSVEQQNTHLAIQKQFLISVNC